MSKRTNICKEGTRLRATHLPSGVYYNYHTIEPADSRYAINAAIVNLILGMYESTRSIFETHLVNKRDDSSLEEVLATQYYLVDVTSKSANAPNLYIASVRLLNDFGKYSFELHDLFVQELTEE